MMMVMVMMVLVLMMMLVLVLVLVMLIVLLLMTRTGWDALQSWRDNIDRCLLAELQPFLLPPIGDAGTTRRSVHRSADCWLFSRSPVCEAASRLAVSFLLRIMLHNTDNPYHASRTSPYFVLSECPFPLPRSFVLSLFLLPSLERQET
jgi:hypothetical protein